MPKIDITLKKKQVAVGHNEVNGRPHGLLWEDRFAVEVTFQTESDARKFMSAVLAATDAARNAHSGPSAARDGVFVP